MVLGHRAGFSGEDIILTSNNTYHELFELADRVAAGVAFMPFHFGGYWQGKDLRAKYPKGNDPLVLGAASNMTGTYGYDSVTMMQETKTTLCNVERA